MKAGFFLFTIFIFNVIFAGGVKAAQKFITYMEPEFLSYDELVILSTNPAPGGALQKKIEALFRTPIISNEAWHNNERPEKKDHPQIGPHLTVATWNIEKSLNVLEAMKVMTSSRSYAYRVPKTFVDVKGVRSNMKRQRERLAGADILILQEMDVGVSRSGFINAPKDLAEALKMNYAYAPAQLEVDPVLLGLEPPRSGGGEVISALAKKYKAQPAKTLGLFGSAVLSKYPIKRVEVFPLKTQPYDWYEGEKGKTSVIEGARRLGTEIVFRNNITRELKVGGRPFFRVDLEVPGLPGDTLTIINVHLEIKCEPSARAEQVEEILSYIKDIPHLVIMAGDFNSSAIDVSATSLQRITTRGIKNPGVWLSVAVNYIPGITSVMNYGRQIFNGMKNFQDPLATHIPVVFPNKVKPMFDKVMEYRFDDGSGFDLRGDAARSTARISRPLGNSNERWRFKGFRPSFSVKRPLWVVGQQRLDWMFVKRPVIDEELEVESYQYAPHFAETLYEFNYCLTSGPISDHSPSLIEMPLEQPIIEEHPLSQFKTLRFAEHWEDSKKAPITFRPTVSERLKGRRFAGKKELLYSVGGQFRERWISTDGFDLRDGDYTSLQHQFRTHLDLESKESWRLYVEGINALNFLDDFQGDRSENTLDLLNAFGEVHVENGFLRVGRQQMEWGAGRILSTAAWRNVPRTWDAISLHANSTNGTISGFAGYAVELHRDHFDEWDKDALLIGAIADWRDTLEGYVLYDEQVTSESIERYTYGLRLDHQFGQLKYEGEGAFQHGNAEGSNVEAYMMAFNVGYLFEKDSLSVEPWLSFESASGDADPEDSTIKTFKSPYPDIHRHLGYGDNIGRGNILGFGQGFNFAPHGEISLTLAHHVFWRMETHDAVYSGVGEAIAEEQLGSGTLVGNEIDATYQYRFNDSVRVDFGFSVFYPAAALADNVSDQQQVYTQFELLF